MRWAPVAALGAFVGDDRGIAAVEFAMILPILVLLWVGGVEVTQALSVDRRVANLSAAIGDLASRSKDLTYGDVDAIFDIAPSAMYPYSQDPTSMVLSAVDIDKDGNASIRWSRARGSVSAYAKKASVTSLINVNLRTPNTQLVMAEVYHNHSPTVGYVITGTVKLDNRSYFAPRVGPTVQLCDNNHLNCS